MMAEKVDFKKTLDSYRAKRGEFRIVDVPEMNYLMIDGAGDPNTSPDFAAAVEALYPVAYKMKFASKNELGRDYVVPPLEGLWWAEDMSAFTTSPDKSAWLWTMMIMAPEWITREIFETAVRAAGVKDTPARLADVRFESLSEGRCVQTLHIGPYETEGAVLATMHSEFIPANGYALSGKHHEVYFSDFRRTAPEKLRTLLRQPVSPSQ